MKTLLNYTVNGGLHRREDNTPAQVGDSVELYLDVAAIPEFPEFVTGVIVSPITSTNCGVSVSYNLEYDEAELLGAASFLRTSDIIDALVVAAFPSFEADLAAEAALRIAGDAAITNALGTASAKDFGTASGEILLLGANGSILLGNAASTISTTGESATISTTGTNASIFTTGDGATIYTTGESASIGTTGASAEIVTSGANASIRTEGVNADIETRRKFILNNGTHTTAVAHAATSNRTITFANASGIIAVVPSYATKAAGDAGVAVGEAFYAVDVKKIYTRLT